MTSARAGGAEDDELDLPEDEFMDLTNKVRRLVCSEPWYRRCVRALLDLEVEYKPNNPGKELHRKKLYPPGGHATSMIRCSDCGHWTPRARLTRERWVKPRDDGSVLERFTPWRRICIDCYYNALPLLEMIQVPSSPGFSTRIPDRDLAAHFGTTEATNGRLQVNGGLRRRRYLHSDGTVREPFRGEDGFDYESVFEVATAAPAAVTEAA